jgi:CheY-like chemotaxis protein
MPALAADRAVNAEAQLRQRHRGARVLLAEDNEVNLEVALAMLHGIGLSVDVAVNGRQAIDMAASARYDLALMDMQMPEVGGLEATRAMRKLPGWRDRPILALTANAFEEDRIACAEAGMSDFITKPMDVQALYESLLRWLDVAAQSQD